MLMYNFKAHLSSDCGTSCNVMNCTAQAGTVSAQDCLHSSGGDIHKIHDDIVIALTVSSGVFVTARCLWKKFGPCRFTAEDYIILVALCISLVANGIAVSLSKYGFGRHFESVPASDFLPLFRLYYYGGNFYLLSLPLIKLSILAFYLRVFQHERIFRLFVWITIIMVIISSLIVSCLGIFYCRPISYAWDKSIKGKCLDLPGNSYMNSTVSLAFDFIIIVLPIPVVWKMSMEGKKKIGVAFMFAVGGISCIASAIKLRVLTSMGKAVDPTWDLVPVTFWATVEVWAGMLASCLPSLRAISMYFYHKSSVYLSLKSSSCNGRGQKASHNNQGKLTRGSDATSSTMFSRTEQGEFDDIGLERGETNTQAADSRDRATQLAEFTTVERRYSKDAGVRETGRIDSSLISSLEDAKNPVVTVNW